MEKNFKVTLCLDLDQTMANVEPLRAISIYYKIFKFQVDSRNYFLSYRVHRERETHTHTHTHTDRQTHRQTQTDMSTLYFLSYCVHRQTDRHAHTYTQTL